MPEGKAEYDLPDLEEVCKPFSFGRKQNIQFKDAEYLYNHFDAFLTEKFKLLETTSEKSPNQILNLLTEMLHYFNAALSLLPGLSTKAGDFMTMIKSFLDRDVDRDVDRGGGGGGGFFNNFTSYSLQFGFPAGISLAFHFKSGQTGHR